MSDVADNNKEAKINSSNVRLVEFGIQTQTSLADKIHKTCCKWAINNLTKSGHNNFITSLIINIGAKFSPHIEDFSTICQCQIDKFHQPSINDID